MLTALVLDIDGVVFPAAPAREHDLVEVGMALRPVRVSAEVCAAVTALAARPRVEPVWLTSWLPETRRAMRPPFPGRDWPQLDLPPAAGWPKWHALTAWLAGRPGLTRLVWIDDDLRQEHRAQLRGLGLDAFTLAPDTATGLTLADLAHVTGWLVTS